MGENMHESRDGTDQSEQRSDADDNFKDDETSFQAHHLVAGTSLDRFDVFRTRPSQILQRHTSDPRQRRRIVMNDSRQHLGTLAGRQPLYFFFKYWRHNLFPLQGDA